MIKVVIGDTTNRNERIMSKDTKFLDALKAANVNTNGTTIHLNGLPLKTTELNKTFREAGVENECSLIAVTKIDNA